MELKTFTLRGIKIELPPHLLTPPILEAISAGRYERLEANQLVRILRDGDRLLELGGGIGYLSSLASKTVKLESCHVIEGNPELVPIIAKTHALNAVDAVVENAIALSRTGRLDLVSAAQDEVAFYLRTNFWGSSLSDSSAYREKVTVPVRDMQGLLDGIHPSVVIADIEGGEVDIFDRLDLRGVRSVLLEVHKSVIGIEGIHRIFATLSREGLLYDPDCSVGAVVHFTRA
ncbi:Methyltransferase, FkbM family [Rhodovulum sp. P5]|uniref:FkbM family methyltransferase n=1 Tax=Rhodovulum sp. P5 TaxID=1564506 RepID=UPI0009C1B0A3|nr:FkbM family methyltransferase [Rhodovulum sp. P5]ARE39198.1 Methyltransferase, FkbM family [Rhodovulum sp. P5]